jgi:hypothetical protein
MREHLNGMKRELIPVDKFLRDGSAKSSEFLNFVFGEKNQKRLSLEPR